MCILEFLKNNRDIFVFVLHCGVQEEKRRGAGRNCPRHNRPFGPTKDGLQDLLTSYSENTLQYLVPCLASFNLESVWVYLVH